MDADTRWSLAFKSVTLEADDATDDVVATLAGISFPLLSVKDYLRLVFVCVPDVVVPRMDAVALLRPFSIEELLLRSAETGFVSSLPLLLQNGVCF